MFHPIGWYITGAICGWTKTAEWGWIDNWYFKASACNKEIGCFESYACVCGEIWRLGESIFWLMSVFIKGPASNAPRYLKWFTV
jgi:hypothetical protein